MAKLVVVTGATGGQGGSVVASLLEHGKYRIRGITRNPSSEKAKALTAKGVEVVAADLNDASSLSAAFRGAHAIFAVTDFFNTFAKDGPEKCMEIEYKQGTNMARVASKIASLEHYMWSTLPNSTKISGQEYLVPHFVAKARVDDFIKQDAVLCGKTTFLWVPFYGSNFVYPMLTPNFLRTAGKYIQLLPCPPDTPITSVGSHSDNVGTFTRAILDRPALTRGGKYVYGKVDILTTVQMLSLWGEATGLETTYVEVSAADYDALWPAWGMEMVLMFKWWDHEREKAWTDVGGAEILTAADLGLLEKDLVSTKQVMEAINWNSILGNSATS